MYWIIDVFIVAIVVICAIRGFQRGLVLALFGALTLIVSLIGAFLIANMFSHHLEGLIESPVSSWVENRMDGWEAPSDTALHEMIHSLGVNHNLTERIEYSVNNQLARAGNSFQVAVTNALVSVIAHSVTFLVAFLGLMLGLRLTASLLDTIAQLPILNLVNKLGGLGGGLLQGILLVWLGITVLSFIGIITPEAVEQTFWLR